MRKIIITGGLGFQGYYLSKLLLHKGYTVIVINPKTARSSHYYRRLNSNKLKVVWSKVSDLVLEKMPLRNSILIHFANSFSLNDPIAITPIPKNVQGKNLSGYSFEQLVKLNRSHELNKLIKGEKKIINVLKRKQPYKIIFISSAAVYEHRNNNSIKENSSLSPRNLYGFSKIVFEKLYLQAFSQTKNITIARLFNVFGPFQQQNNLGSFLVKTIYKSLSNLPISINGNGNQKRDPLYIDDASRAYYLILTAPKNYLIYNIGSGRPISVKNITQLIVQLTKSKSRITYSNNVSGHSFYANIDRLKSIGFKPKDSLKKGIQEIISTIQI